MQVASGGPRPAPGTLNALFFEAIDRFDKPDAMLVKIAGTFQPISHRTILTRVRRIARGLVSLGIARGDRVAILSENRPEWALADYACLTAGFADVSVYPMLPPEYIAYVLGHSGARAVLVSTADQASKVAAVRYELPSLAFVIAFDEVPRELVTHTLEDIERLGAEGDDDAAADDHRRAALEVGPGDLATLLYTSGTTGNPKGVMLSHDNIFSNVAAVEGLIDFTGRDVALSILPLSHIFERTIGHYAMFATGTTIAYAESLDTVAADMVSVRPTLAAAAPRLYEKIFARVVENASSGGGVKLKIFNWARSVGESWTTTTLSGKPVGPMLSMKYRLADKLVFAKLRARTGGRFRYFFSGGAPLAVDINSFFYAAGLTILEGYGLTETSPVISANIPGAYRIGTVGVPVAGSSVTIAEDGEILARGPNIMLGYYNNPEATREAIDADGWFHTGDIGELRDGFLAITDRKKDLIVTAGGKNIAPQPVEGNIKTSKMIAEAVMIGDRRKFPIVLIVPEFSALESWARANSISWKTREELVALPSVQKLYEDEVAKAVEGLAHYETPRKVLLLPNEFTMDSGEITPTLKVKRRVIDQRYKSLIDDLYARAETDPPASIADRS